MKQEPTICFFVAGCMEFQNLAELHEGLTLAQAVDVFVKIRKRNSPYLPGIGFVLKDDGLPDFSDMPWPLYQGGKVAREEIAMIPAFAGHPLVKNAVRELEHYIPMMEKALKRKVRMER